MPDFGDIDWNAIFGSGPGDPGNNVPPPNDTITPGPVTPDPPMPGGSDSGGTPDPNYTAPPTVPNSPGAGGDPNTDPMMASSSAIVAAANKDPNFMSMLSALAKAFGMNTNGTGWLIPLAAMLAGGLGTLNLNNRTNAAAGMIQNAAQGANKQAMDLIGPGSGAMANFTPYIQTGQKSNADLYNMVGNNNLAGNFQPLATHAFTPNPGITTLAQLAKKK